MVGIFVCNFVPLYWLTNNNENENKNENAYDREREGVQEGADGALTDEV